MVIPAAGPKRRAVPFHPFLPRFKNPKLERQYRDSRLEYRVTALRISCLAGIAIWVLFTSLDLLTTHDPSVALSYIRIIGIISLIIVFIATYFLRLGRWLELFGFTALAIQIPLLVCLLAFLSPASLPYYQPAEVWTLIGVASFVLCGVSFAEGSILAFATICAFFISILIFKPEPELALAFHFSWLVATIFFVGVGSFVLDRTQHISWLQEQELSKAQAQIRTLLHNVLPPSIAARKLAGETPIADQFAEASILFADVVDFTSLSARLGSSEIVGMLGDLFSRFDRVIARQGLEKIKTIGDCYMAAGGVPQPVQGHVKKLAQAAVEMLEETKSVRAADGSPIDIRIGMHSGPVTAGVIGEAKFIFDVWGDTVNTASRMESHGIGGRIQVTDTVRTALANEYDFEGPQIAEIKGKGPTRIWFLQSRRDSSVESPLELMRY